jgi:hypothetical protein
MAPPSSPPRATWPTAPPWAYSGTTLRTPAEHVALACRILENRHAADVVHEAGRQLGAEGRASLGPIDLTRNPLRDYAHRIGRAYQRPPAVTGLPPQVVTMLGTAAASTLTARYAEIDAVPMPTQVLRELTEALRYRLGAVSAGVLVGETRAGEDRRGPVEGLFIQAIAPCDLHVEYHADDPREPSLIMHRRRRRSGTGDMVDAEDVYDLRDPEAPVFMSRRVAGGEEFKDLTMRGDAYPWRRPDGRPYHRIVIQGDPRRPFDTAQLVEGALKTPVLWTWWAGGLRDAGFPQRYVIGLELAGMGSDDGHGAGGGGRGSTGIGVTPQSVLVWRQAHPDVPGQIGQWGPGFDPEVTGRAVRAYEQALLAEYGLPMQIEGTGGDPAELEERRVAERIRGTLDETRRSDAAVLTRCCWALGIEPPGAGSGAGIGILYLDEIDDALGAAAAEREAEAMRAAGQGGATTEEPEEATDDDPTVDPAR